MAEPKENVLMEKLVSLCKRRGFVFQSSEIYGGINGFWDYGPLGAELKRNVKELWWNTMTRQREDVAGLEATIIMSPKIWEASGHTKTFSDPMCDCLLTKKRFRADQIEAQSGVAYWYSGAVAKSGYSTAKQLLKSLCPNESEEKLDEALVKFVTSLVLAEPSSEQPSTDEIVERIRQRIPNEPELERLKAVLHETKVTMVFVQLRSSYSAEPYAALLKAGKPPESARKAAIQFYAQRGIEDPVLFGERTEDVQNSQRFNPENGSLLTEPRPFNLMFKTYVGPVESAEGIAYLRPETAQAIFAQFKNVLETSRQKVPFGIGQIGKAFRNEVTPRNFTFRSREFEQMELEFFIKPDEAVEAISGRVATAAEVFGVPPSGGSEPAKAGTPNPEPNWGWEVWHKYWVEERVRFYEGIGLSRDTLAFHNQTAAELAHYARACTDILFKFPFSKRDENGELKGEELEGIAARSDFDLSQHARFSGKPMGVFDEELRTAWGKLPKEKQDDIWRRYYENRKRYMEKSGVETEAASKQATEDANGLAKGQYIPHVIEPSAGVDRLILALIANAYTEVTKTDDKGKSETTVVMKFHPRVAPIKVAVLPLLKNKPELVAIARSVYLSLRGQMNVFFDDGGSIGRRYARQDEAGTPFCVTIDFDSLGEKPELKDTVTIRHRDDGKQERIPITELAGWLLARVR